MQLFTIGLHGDEWYIILCMSSNSAASMFCGLVVASKAPSYAFLQVENNN